ncbi:MAG: MsnO8 family LLM class oxidoreductase [Balneolaceae bacterium]
MKLSIVDISPVSEGVTRTQALHNTIKLAQKAEELGYTRFWVAEHHSAASVAGRAPEIMIAAIAAKTKSILVGSGSVLLNHYSSYKVAEVFSTLEEIYPNRIDLGIGRATTGPISDIALQQDRSKRFHSNSNEQLAELLAWLENSFPSDHAFSTIPIYSVESKPNAYLLGSSIWSSDAAALLGLRYVFAGFINQLGAPSITENYFKKFNPSTAATSVETPELIMSVHAVCADTEMEARRLLAPVTYMYKNLGKGKLDEKLFHPENAIELLGYIPELVKYDPETKLIPKFIAGTQEMVKEQLDQIAKDYNVEEFIIQDVITDFDARLHSYELLSEFIE